MGARGSSSNHFTLGRFLTATQIAITVPLALGAGLFLKTLGNLNSVDLGFDSADLIVFRVNGNHVTPHLAGPLELVDDGPALLPP